MRAEIESVPMKSKTESERQLARRTARSKQGSWFRERGGLSCFAAETYVIVEVQEVEPALNVFARLG
jgi:hypothetical protein